MNASNIQTQTVGFWKGLPPTAKVLIVAGILVGGYIAYRKISKNIQTNQDVKEVGDELQATVESGIRPSLSPTQVTVVAEGLYESMDGYIPRRDTYLENFKKYFWMIKNKADLLAVIKKFGNKDGYDLKGWIQAEYPSANRPVSDNLISVADVANQHLRAMGIDYKF